MPPGVHYICILHLQQNYKMYLVTVSTSIVEIIKFLVFIGQSTVNENEKNANDVSHKSSTLWRLLDT